LYCTIDGRPVSPEVLACQERHFGQVAKGIQLFTYEIRMDRAEFVSRSGPLYQEHVGYEKLEEPYYRAGEDAQLDRWHRLGYPPLDRLVEKDPEILTYLLRWRLGSALLRSLFPAGTSHVRFALNTLDTIDVGPDGVALAGRAWEI
jgi:hypothetical protein